METLREQFPFLADATAGYALKEVVYLSTVHAGFPRAIDAAGVLSELFAERRQDGAD